MNWKSTCLLLALAAVLLVFIYLVERHTKATSSISEPPAHLVSLKPAEVTSLQLRRTNQLILRVEKTNESWNLTVPLFYPAQSYAVENVLKTIADVTSQAYLSTHDLAASGKTIAEFGLDLPAATLTLQRGGRRTEVSFGSKTATGDQVYVQLLNSPGIYVINADLFDLLPHSSSDWRDTSLVSVSLNGLSFNRIEVRAPSRGFTIEWDPTNKVFNLTKPTPARVNMARLETFWRAILTGRAEQFVTDDPRAELEEFGLRPPGAELAFGLGTNDIAVVQFGKSPTNDPTRVYIRRMSHTNIVLAPKTVLEAVQVSPNELRDRRLLSFSTNAIDTVEVVGPESFAVRRQFNGVWVVLEPQATLVDSDLMREWLNLLGALEGTVEKDLVTDFAAYSLATPARQYLLKSTITNLTGLVTNRTLAALQIGARQDNKVFVRRDDETSVYWIDVTEFTRLPSASWQLRDRRVWSFTTNQVSRVTIRHRGYTRQMIRNGSGEWSLAPGSQGVIDPFAIEETLFRLGELRAAVWVARGEENRSRFGFVEDGYKLTIELKTGDKTHALNLEFAEREKAPSQFPYAMAAVDGQNWIFEFPLQLYFHVLRDLSNPTPRPSSAGL